MPGLSRPIGCDVRDGARLRHPVALHHVHVVHLRDAAGDVDRQRRSAGHDEAHARQVRGFAAVGEEQHRRRHHEEVRRLVLRDDLEETLRVEAGQDHLRRADGEGRDHQHGHAVDVEERQEVDQRREAVDQSRRDRLADVGRDVEVAEHHALRDAGRPGRVRQHREMRRRVEDRRLRVSVARRRPVPRPPTADGIRPCLPRRARAASDVASPAKTTFGDESPNCSPISRSV